jgi:lysophospholipid acyltransferase (LPLAT)-like uncharacterized protein
MGGGQAGGGQARNHGPDGSQAAGPGPDPGLGPKPVPDLGHVAGPDGAAPEYGSEPGPVAGPEGAGPEAGPAPARVPRRFFLDWPSWAARLYGWYARRCLGLRFEGYPGDLEGPCIFITWHSEELSLLPRFGFIRGAIIISDSKDGDILSAVVSRWGYPVIRGSSSRGAVRAVMSLKKALAAGQSVIMAVDGPRGPLHRAKAGAYWLAAKTGRPICPVGAAVSRCHVFRKSWSQSRLPLPFSRIACHFGRLIWLREADLSLDSGGREDFLTAAMDRSMEAAGRLLKSWPGNCSNQGVTPA